MKTYNILVKPLIISVVFFFLSCNNASVNEKEENKTKYIFYFIADGMGYSHVSLTESYLANIEGKISQKELIFSSFPHHGSVSTFAKNRQATGSAAAGTALARGKKENIDNIAYFDGDYNESKSILQIANEKGFSTGLISTVSINHATPAAFYANSDLRKKYYEIAKQLPDSNIDYLGGGGIYKNTGEDNLQEDIFEMLMQKDFSIISDIENIDFSKFNKLYFLNPIVLSEAEMPYSIDNHDKSYNLKDFVKIGIDFLKTKDSFFMVIEGGKIDWASHDNDAATIVKEVIDFNHAVNQAYEFYLQNPDETLIIVTADHETGGLGLGINKNRYNTNFAALDNQKISQYNLAYMLELEKRKEKTPNFTEILNFIKTNFFVANFELSKNELDELQSAYLHFITPQLLLSSEKAKLYNNYCPLAFTCTKIINNRASIGFTTGYHTAADVPIYSIGNGSNNFTGSMDNTDIFGKLLNIIEN